MRKAEIAAYRDGSVIWRLPEFAEVASLKTQETVRAHALELQSNPNMMPCGTVCGPPGGGGDWVQITSFASGAIIGDGGVPVGSWVSYTTNTYYYGSANVGGFAFSGTNYYPSQPPPENNNCGIAAGTWITAASQAAKAIIANPNALGGAASAFANAGMSALKTAEAWIEETGEPGEATMAGAVALISQLFLMMTPIGWLTLIGIVGSLVVLVYATKACMDNG
jgi:hypothetical protein